MSMWHWVKQCARRIGRKVAVAGGAVAGAVGLGAQKAQAALPEEFTTLMEGAADDIKLTAIAVLGAIVGIVVLMLAANLLFRKLKSAIRGS